MAVLQKTENPPVLTIGQGKRVLVVEDDPSVGYLLSITFELAGLGVTMARSVGAARAALGMATFDACIVDMHLPDGTGLDLLRSLRSLKEELPVVVLSGARQNSLIEAATQLGANDYITKPFSPTRLTAIVQRWIAS